MANISLLLVEDNELNQKLIFLNLKKYDFKIDVARNGLEALDFYEQQPYDLILMDLMMPVMDGLEATAKIRNLEKEKGGYTFIIGLTANVYDADREKCIGIGMDEFLTKPFDVNRFMEIIKKQGIYCPPA